MKNTNRQLFLSYSGSDMFEASLLQYASESMLDDVGAKIWTYQRDQSNSQRNIAGSLKDRVKQSKATIFLVSPVTLDSGAAQWIELGYSDAFDIPTFVLLHHLSFKDLKIREKGVPPLLLEGQCNPAYEWKTLAADLRRCLRKKKPLTK
jgi:hypothetical protein